MIIRYFYRAVLCIAVVLGVTQQATSQSSVWNASIVSASSEEPLYISGDDWPGRPANHRWVKLIVQLTSPGKQAKVPVAQIKLSNSDGSYPATAIGYQVKPSDSIVYLPLLVVTPPHPDKGLKEAGKEKLKVGGGWSTLRAISGGRLEPVSVGFFEKMDINKMLFDVELKGANGGKELRLVKSPLNLVLLFAIPDGAGNLQLHIGESLNVAVPAVQ